MPIELKNVWDTLGFENDPNEIESQEKFKELFEKKYTTKKSVDDSIGSIYGSSIVQIKKALKKFGLKIDKSEEELKQLKPHELYEMASEMILEHYTSEVEKLKGQSGPVSDEKLKALEQEMDKWKGKFTEADSARQNVVSEYEKYKVESANQFKNYKKDNAVNEIHSKFIKWASGVSDLTKRGFFATLDEKYKLDYTDDGKLIPLNKDGSRIPHPTKSGEFIEDYQSVIQKEAIEADVWEKNPHAGKQRPDPVVIKAGDPTIIAPPPGMGKREIAPRV